VPVTAPVAAVREPEEIDVAAYVLAVWRAKWVLAAIVIGAAVVAFVVVSRMPARHQASVGLSAMTLWAAPLDAPAIANIQSAVRSSMAWAQALRDNGIDPATAPPVTEAAVLAADGGDNALRLTVTLSGEAAVIAVANDLARLGVERARQMRERMVQDASRAGAPDLDQLRTDLDAASRALSEFIAAQDIRWIEGQPYGPGRRVLPAEVRQRLDTLTSDQTIASSLYTQTRLWQADQRRLAANRLPLLAIADAAAPPAVRVGPRPARAALLAALVAALAALGGCVALELGRRLIARPPTSRTMP
jgi:uncharacterized protein involved in exopolysaccharide biosynthesis